MQGPPPPTRRALRRAAAEAPPTAGSDASADPRDDDPAATPVRIAAAAREDDDATADPRADAAPGPGTDAAPDAGADAFAGAGALPEADAATGSDTGPDDGSPSAEDAAPEPPDEASRDAAHVPEAAEPDPTESAPAESPAGVGIAAPTSTGEAAALAPETAAVEPGAPSSEARSSAASVPVVVPPASPALSWVDERAVAGGSRPVREIEAAAPAFVPVTADLLARAPRRTPLRPGVLVPIGVILAVVVAYCATTLLWPLHAVAPTVTQIAVEPVAAPAAVGAWPAEGSAAVSVAEVSTPIASSADALSIASITKVVTALLVLDEMPLALGEQGREYRFSSSDGTAYWQYLSRGESALDVPVGGSLTEYQLLQGMLIGSANNYADRLASTIWPTDEVFARAANDWLAQHGVPGITIADPTGIDAGNIASPEALLLLAERALADPVIAEIVRTPAVELPGAGIVENSNPLLADPGVVGIKTGTLDAYNLLAAKDVTVGDTTVRVYAATLGQPDSETRAAATRALFAQVEQELQLRPSVVSGTVAGQVETQWGEPVPIIAAADAEVLLWNGAVASLTSTFDLGDHRDGGDVVGSLAATGPRDTATVDLVLAGDVDEPSPLWRLTHPLQLFGLV